MRGRGHRDLSCWGHLLMQPSVDIPPSLPKDRCISYPEIHWQVTQSTLPGRKPQSQQINRGLARSDTRSLHLVFLVLAHTAIAIGQSTMCQLSQMDLPPPRHKARMARVPFPAPPG